MLDLLHLLLLQAPPTTQNPLGHITYLVSVKGVVTHVDLQGAGLTHPRLGKGVQVLGRINTPPLHLLLAGRTHSVSKRPPQIATQEVKPSATQRMTPQRQQRLGCFKYLFRITKC